MLYRHTSLPVALVLALSVPMFLRSQAFAQNPQAAAQANGATAFLRSRHEAVERILRRPARTPADQQRRQRDLLQNLGDLLDYAELSRRSLAQTWDARSEAERTEFLNLLKQLVERGYQKNLEATLEYEIAYVNETVATDGAVTVRTNARSRANRRSPPVAIDYTMRRVGNTWRVFDITTDGVSLVRNYRNQFSRIVTRDGWPALVTRLRQKLQSNADF